MKSLVTTILLLGVVAIGQSRRLKNETLTGPKTQRYFLSDRVATWIDAFQQCKNMFPHSELATLQTISDVYEIKSFLDDSAEFSGEYWLGGRLRNMEGCDHYPLQSRCWTWERVPPIFINDGILPFDTNIGDPHYASALTLINIDMSPKLSHSSITALRKFICDEIPSS